MIIGIVGAGPRGLSMVERLIRNNRENQHIQICLFDPDGPGGRVWRLDQPTELLMNSVSQQVTLFTDETLTSGGEISPGPNLYQWSQTEAKKYIEKQQFVNKEFFLAEAERLRANEPATRCFYGLYQQWFYEQLKKLAPHSFTIVRSLVKEIDKIKTGFYLKTNEQHLVVDQLVMTTGQLKSYYAAGNMPDIFVFGGGDYTANFKGMVADLSDCEFVKDTDFALMDGNQVVGFPYTIEGYGISYNADILEQAGVDPDTLTNYQAFEKAFEKIDSMKDELGLTAVCSVAAESGQMSWSTGGHLFGYYLSGGLERDDNTYFDELMEGKIDEERLTQFGKFFGLLCKYSDQQTLISSSLLTEINAPSQASFATWRVGQQR